MAKMKFIMESPLFKRALKLFYLCLEEGFPLVIAAGRKSVTFNTRDKTLFLKLACPATRIIRPGSVSVSDEFLRHFDTFPEKSEITFSERVACLYLKYKNAGRSKLTYPKEDRRKMLWVPRSPLVHSINMEFSMLRDLLVSSSFAVGNGQGSARFNGSIVLECDYNSIRAIGTGEKMTSIYQTAIENGRPMTLLLPKRIADIFGWVRGDTGTISIYEDSVVISIVRGDLVLSISVKRQAAEPLISEDFSFREGVTVSGPKEEILRALSFFVNHDAKAVVLKKNFRSIPGTGQLSILYVDSEMRLWEAPSRVKVVGGALSISADTFCLYAAVYHARGHVTMSIDTANNRIIVTGEDKNYIARIHAAKAGISETKWRRSF
jgi:hypothetical protein